jgi:organic radical activating enzyme
MTNFTPDTIITKNLSNLDQPDFIYDECDTLRVAFQLGNPCTYNCSYCPPMTKDGSIPWPDVDKAIAIVDRIHEVYTSSPYNKKVIIYDLQGGEPTVWKDIEKLLIHINEIGDVCQILTNASRSVRWWDEYGKYFDRVTMSFHPESADKVHFTEVIKVLQKNNVNCGAAILMLPELWDKCIDAKEYILENCDIELYLKILKDQSVYPAKMWPYTDDQLKYIEGNGHFKQKVPHANGRKYGSSTLLYDSKTNTHQRIITDRLIVTNQNRWRGWQCNIGIDTLLLDQHGRIRKGAYCYKPHEKPEHVIGNWKTDDVKTLKFPTEAVTCHYDACWCIHDIRARKYKDKS